MKSIYISYEDDDGTEITDRIDVVGSISLNDLRTLVTEAVMETVRKENSKVDGKIDLFVRR
jgi:hypothetical protein